MTSPPHLASYPSVPHTPYVDDGQDLAAEAAELRRVELGLTQAETGVTPKIWRLLVNKERWPNDIRARARIEAHLNWHIGSLAKIARGEITPEEAALEHRPPPDGKTEATTLEHVSALLDEARMHYTDDQAAMAKLKLRMARDLIDRALAEPNQRDA